MLFQTADEERTGNIGGNKAVSFFTQSKLPIATLKDIWTLSDQPPTNALDPMKFAVAIRLIQCEQNGISVASLQQQQQSSDLQQGLPPNLRPVFFEGIPIPPAAAASSSSTAAGGGGGGGAPPRPPVPTTPLTAAATAMVPPPTRHHQYGGADGVSVGGGGGSVAPSVVGSVATMPPPQYQLTVQDPYSITPTEQGRYEQNFSRLYHTAGTPHQHPPRMDPLPQHPHANA
jgi:Cytoskeletal-regulatory complex EF hand